MVGTVHVKSLFFLLGLEACIRELIRLLLQFLACARVVCEHPVCVAADAGPVSFTPLLVQHALLLLLVLEIHLVPAHHSVVLFSPRLHLISKLRMLLGNLYLFLQPLLFVVQLSKPVLQHLRLNLLLLHMQLLLELAGAFHARCVVFILRLEIVNLDVAEAEILAH